MAKLDASWEGLATVEGVLHNVKGNATAFLVGSMQRLANDVFAESQKQCPVRFGVLRASGHVGEVSVAPGNIELPISYSAPYAIFVHENLRAHHAPPTKAKFLEDPFKDALNGLEPKLQGRMEAAMLVSYPQAPAAAVSAGMVGAMKEAHYGARQRHAVATSPGMSRRELNRAMSEMRHGARGWIRHRTTTAERDHPDAAWYLDHRQRSRDVAEERNE